MYKAVQALMYDRYFEKPMFMAEGTSVLSCLSRFAVTLKIAFLEKAIMTAAAEFIPSTPSAGTEAFSSRSMTF